MPRKTSTATRLPAQFVRKPVKALKRKTLTKGGYRNLPFVANKYHYGFYWNVPATGGYFGGYETGAAMASLFLKYLRNDDGSSIHNPLTHIVESFAARMEQAEASKMERLPIGERSAEWSSVRGQLIGFFNTLNHWLMASAKHMGTNLDHLTEQDLIRRANCGLGFDNDAYMASFRDE